MPFWKLHFVHDKDFSYVFVVGAVLKNVLKLNNYIVEELFNKRLLNSCKIYAMRCPQCNCFCFCYFLYCLYNWWFPKMTNSIHIHILETYSIICNKQHVLYTNCIESHYRDIIKCKFKIIMFPFENELTRRALYLTLNIPHLVKLPPYSKENLPWYSVFCVITKSNFHSTTKLAFSFFYDRLKRKKN